MINYFFQKIRSPTFSLISFIVFSSMPAHGISIKCGGKFSNFVERFTSEARELGLKESTLNGVLDLVKQDEKVLAFDRSQKSFRMSFLEFSEKAVNQYRIINGRKKIKSFSELFDYLEYEYGIPSEVVVAFWAMETDFGAVQGNFNTLNALATLAHDCRRSQMFQIEFLAALRLIDHKIIDFDTIGAWAGEIGQVQMLPSDILIFGKDGNGDSNIDLKGSPEDAITTAYELVSHLGWEPNQPWLDEVRLDKNFKFDEAGFGRGRSVEDWVKLGVRGIPISTIESNIDALLLLPQGKNGPSFLAYPNYKIFLEWNDSFIYTVTAAYLAKRLQGDAPFSHMDPENILDNEAMLELQERLANMGEDVGEIDGILGAKTRQAVRKWQLKTGFVADSWPTEDFLEVIRSL